MAIRVLLLLLIALAAGVAYLYPRLGAYSMWFAVWMYPIGILHGILPLNIRFDDLWVVSVFFCSILSPNRSYVLRDKKMIYIAVLWFTAYLLGNLVGLSTGAGSEWRSIIKMIGKAAYVPMIAVILKNTIHSKEDVIRHLKAILIAGVGAALIGILQTYRPLLVMAWEIPSYLYVGGLAEKVTVGELERRGGGALGIIYLAVTCMVLIIVALRLWANRNRIGLRVLGAISVFIMVVGLAVTVTRSVIGATFIGVLHSLVYHRKRFLLIFIIGCVTILILTQTNIYEKVQARFEGRVGEVRGAYQIRSEIWKRYIRNPSVHYLLFGRGMIPEMQRLYETVHNGYIAAFAYMGSFGAIIIVYLMVTLWKIGKRLKTLAWDPFAVSMGEIIGAIIMATLFVNMFGEHLEGFHVRLLVALGVLGSAYYELGAQEIMLSEYNPEEVESTWEYAD